MNHLAMARGPQEYVWLSEACEAFGPPRLVRLARKEGNKAPDPLPVISATSSPEEAMNAIGVAMRNLIPPRPALQELREHVSGMLYRGVLEARGIQVSPTPGIAPEPIPKHMFSEPLKVGWNNSRIKKSGRIYEEIEVRLATAAQPIPVAPARTVARPSGRPTKQDEIHKLIDEIGAGGFDLNSIGRKEACDRIRAEAEKRKYNTAIGYSEPVLKRAITLKLGERK